MDPHRAGSVAMEQSSPAEQQSNAQDQSPARPEDAGGPWAVTESLRLRRFLCYGSESATYSTRERALGPENALALMELVQAGRGQEVVEEVKRLSLEGKTVRPNPALFALAVCTQYSDAPAKQAAFRALQELCKAPGQLFTFIQYKKELKDGLRCGMWGRGLRRAVSDWYNGQDALSLAHTVTRCKHRAGWSHQDLFRLSHMKPANDSIELISKYVTKGWKVVQETYAEKESSEELLKVFAYLEAVEKAKHSTDEQEVVHLIEEHRLEREQILTNHLKSKEVWKALLKEMPVAALMRHLGKMTADKVLVPGSPEVAAVCERIQDDQALTKAKTHPFSILVASENYKRGHGKRGKRKWEPSRDIVHALDSAFCKSLSNVEPTGKRFVVGVDVSASLSSLALGSSVSTIAVAAAMSMVIARSEPEAEVLIFSEGAMVPCVISDDTSLIQVTAQLVQVLSAGTDCALPIEWASENDKTVDVFIIFTSNETQFGSTNPAEVLRTYREKTGVFSKLIVCGMATNGLSVADPDDRGMLDICGFDSRAVDIIRNFVLDVI
ncbi:60 kDa SS-A/Ro ribonucleoprotein isoform X1 [Pygocentrus nattereri]|uniref:TROVE domain-containing protein n=2 Tax=Pygocentrus nattereri TaxID=42514 RepID=A0AAR2JD58_PYGNA|nr:60 kDa SS-A/Ro ribonucleoprotein isoform X1 [Pygocentrus nattereri]